MIFLRLHILFKIFAFTLLLTLLLPSAVKFMHVFENHHHEVCYGEPNAHFHTLDVDCEFYKFQLNTPFTIPEINSVSIDYPAIKTVITTNYQFLSDYQRLHFPLRGPPELI